MARSFWNILVHSKRYLYLSVLLFFIGMVVGYAFLDLNSPIIQSILRNMETVVEKIKTNDTVFFMIRTIFLNNLFLAVLMILSGLLLGLYPMISLTVQGIMLGFIIKHLFSQGRTIGFVLLGILPHGILEIPGIFIASAYGIKLGFSLLRLISKAITKDNKEEHIAAEFLLNIRRIPIVLIGLTIILFIAAVIESTATGYLLQSVYR
ncbi:stage II sporulation protein M [Tepidibacillus marianensis]|uniref:stage II sporulation protein M n=1 Tax=Tepidibacillus marianensis TaxID=3131995 RepID=UPI0030CA9136